MKADITGDGVFTISDVWAWMEFIGCWPGNLALRWLSGNSIGRFFEITPFDQYTGAAWTISVVAWVAVVGIFTSSASS
jgi:hypothetical protein